MTSQTTILDTFTTAQGERHLKHRTAGTIPAGAGSTTVNESWGSILTAWSGTRHGQWFSTKAEAEAYHERMRANHAKA